MTHPARDCPASTHGRAGVDTPSRRPCLCHRRPAVGIRPAGGRRATGTRACAMVHRRRCLAVGAVRVWRPSPSNSLSMARPSQFRTPPAGFYSCNFAPKSRTTSNPHRCPRPIVVALCAPQYRSDAVALFLDAGLVLIQQLSPQHTPSYCCSTAAVPVLRSDRDTVLIAHRGR